MPDEHARISPSAAERWMTCPASVQAEESLPDDESVYAAEGTLAHSVAEAHLNRGLGRISPAEFETRMNGSRAEAAEGHWDHEDMIQHAERYAQSVVQLAEDLLNPAILVEQRVHPGIQECWGTSDAVIISEDQIIVVDYKYGQGVRVDACYNPQMMLYGAGALEEFGDLLDVVNYVTLVVIQPRREHFDSFTLAASELRQWRDRLKPVAEEALGDNPRFNPTQQACRFCKFAGRCSARANKMLSEDFVPVSSPADALSAEQLADALERIPELEQWCADVKKDALRRAYQDGESIPRWKVVRNAGRRYVSDVDAATQKLGEAGFESGQYLAPTKLLSLSALDKLAGGKSALAELLGDSLDYRPGGPALAGEDDPRQEVTREDDAKQDFKPLN